MPSLPASLIEALRRGEVIPFVGAGVSMAVTDADGARLFPSWRELLCRAAERLRAEGLTKKANRAQAELDDDDFLKAAETARAALGTEWCKFLRDQFDLSSDL